MNKCQYRYRGCNNSPDFDGWMCKRCNALWSTRWEFAVNGARIPFHPPPVRYPASGNYRPDNIHWSIWVDRHLACKARVDGNP